MKLKQKCQNARRILPRPTTAIVVGVTVLILSACGGGDASVELNTRAITTATATQLASGISTFTMDVPIVTELTSSIKIKPSFKIAPVQLEEPQDMESRMGRDTVQKTWASKGATPSRKSSVQQTAAANDNPVTPQGTSVAPMATSTAVTTYIPSQIRAAYNLPPLPAVGAPLTANQAAQLGAGQTIYIVDAMHDPNVVAELTAFNQKFSLPGCTTKTLVVTAPLPLAAPSKTACEFTAVYTTTTGAMTTQAPAYDNGWATEIALDVQWAHATAPLARIVLIESPDASLNSLLGAIKLANTMGPGIVSMSFGAVEGNWTDSVDSVFKTPNMTYLAATGDNGTGVEWPSVSPSVVAVGGTTLTYTPNSTRSETSWSGTGGGISTYVNVPSYQNNTVPGLGTVYKRIVADVAFNADPATGQYVAVSTPGSTAMGWVSAGGTSLSTPQWAGIIAIANATRALAAKTVLAQPHATLYNAIASVPGYYASSFADVIKGTDGACATCTAKSGYDPLSGIGTPNVSNLVNVLNGVTPPSVAPVINNVNINGVVGTPLSFTASAVSINPLTYSLSAAPTGMAMTATGYVTWATTIAGTYNITVTARDTVAALQAQATYTIIITSPVAPSIGNANINAAVGTAFSYTAVVTAINPLSYTLTNAPAGMDISTTGVVTWPKPVLSTYTVTINVKDTKTNLIGKGTLTVNVQNAPSVVNGPVIVAPALTGVNGKPLTGMVSVTDAGKITWLSISVTGAPMGMGMSMSGSNIILNWPSAVTGVYNLNITATDSLGLSSKVTMPISIMAK